MASQYKYTFAFKDGSGWSYQLNFDEQHRLLPAAAADIRPWTRLEYHQCDGCPLKKETTPQCPVARNLDPVVEDSKNAISCQRVRVTVETPNRTYLKDCDTQQGLRSLFGVIMSSSGCPYLDWLRPLGRMHLPFANTDETLFRVLSLQLVAEFLGVDGSRSGDSSAAINERYAKVRQVNNSFARRIRSYCSADADKNAVASLDVFVELFSLHMENNFMPLRKLFE
jgi:hypothetical protein